MKKNVYITVKKNVYITLKKNVYITVSKNVYTTVNKNVYITVTKNQPRPQASLASFDVTSAVKPVGRIYPGRLAINGKFKMAEQG